jgi:hypothetical protein
MIYFCKMRKEEYYFIIVGCLVAIAAAFAVARYNAKQGYSFGKNFFYTSIILIGAVFYIWQWIWVKK